jgi:hypothetical protein
MFFLRKKEEWRTTEFLGLTFPPNRLTSAALNTPLIIPYVILANEKEKPGMGLDTYNQASKAGALQSRLRLLFPL